MDLAAHVDDRSPRGIAATVARLVRGGDLRPGDRLPTVRAPRRRPRRQPRDRQRRLAGARRRRTGPASVLDALVARRMLGPGWTSRLLQHVLVDLLTDSAAIEAVAHARRVYFARRRALREALATHDIALDPGDGINLWLPVHDERTALVRLEAAGIRVAPGTPFSGDGPRPAPRPRHGRPARLRGRRRRPRPGARRGADRGGPAPPLADATPQAYSVRGTRPAVAGSRRPDVGGPPEVRRAPHPRARATCRAPAPQTPGALIPMPRTRPVLLTAVAALALAACSAQSTPEAAPTETASASATFAPVTLDNCGTEVTIDTRRRRRSSPSSRPPRRCSWRWGCRTRIDRHGVRGRPGARRTTRPRTTRSRWSRTRCPARRRCSRWSPDFVYAGWESNFSADGAGERAALHDLGIGTYVSPAACKEEGYMPDPLTFDEVADEIREVAAIFGVPERAEELDRRAGGHARRRASSPPRRRPRSGTAPGRTPRTSARASARRR